MQTISIDVHCFKNFLSMVFNGKKCKKNYDEDSNKGYILEVDVECPKDL